MPLVVFAAGCLSGAVAREAFSVPQAVAQGAERYDYFCFVDDNTASVEGKLKRAGAQGWDLSVSTGAYWCMKRRL
jgi:hypothetical protein